MAKFRKRPVVVDAVQWAGDNWAEVYGWVMSWDLQDPGIQRTRDGIVLVSTLEGDMRADRGDWIIRGIKGEFYPCKPEIFAATYEAVEGAS
jgi:hypothetical protein